MACLHEVCAEQQEGYGKPIGKWVSRTPAIPLLATETTASSSMKLWLPKNSVLQFFLSRFLHVAGVPAWIRTPRHLLDHALTCCDLIVNERRGTPVTIGSRLGVWPVCWLGSWTRAPALLIVNGRACTRSTTIALAKSARRTSSQQAKLLAIRRPGRSGTGRSLWKGYWRAGSRRFAATRSQSSSLFLILILFLHRVFTARPPVMPST